MADRNFRRPFYPLLSPPVAARIGKIKQVSEVSMRRHRTRCRDATIFQTDVSSSPAKSRRSSVLRTTDGDGRGPRVRPGTWRATLMAPSAEVHFGLRRSPLLWWGRWRLRKAQMLQNGSGRFEVGNHGQDLAFPSTSGAPEQLKPKGSFPVSYTHLTLPTTPYV